MGSTLQLTAEAFDENGEAVAGVEFSWESSDAAIATVDAGGLVTGVAVGVATITASAGSAEGAAEVTVADLDRAALVALYEGTDGPNWTNADTWLTDAPLREWYGVDTDAQGQVTELSLWSNNLTGPISPELGNLASLKGLSLSGNDLSGPIPPELGNLASLEKLHLGNNDLTGRILPELSNLASLTQLYLYGNDLTGPVPTELGSLANLEWLLLGNNDLTGSIPPELSNLANLKGLSLRGTELSGPIPSELSNLANLESLFLDDNDLTGPIPPKLGSLASLTDLWLQRNNLTGHIPPELGNLASLTKLYLHNNSLSGPIQPQLGNLDRLEWLTLKENDLTGPIPPELGNLTDLKLLALGDNDLTGPVPPELGGMFSLRSLSFASNPGLSGALPARFTDLHRLETLLAEGTDLCVPDDPGFQAWLEMVHRRRIASCASTGASTAYLTQAVQSRKYPVPLVAGEQALLRVFVTAVHTTAAGIPPIRARFYLNGTESDVVDVPAKPMPIPRDVMEHDLSGSANAEIPGDIVQPGLEMVIEIDPEGTLDPSLGVAKRIPETGRMAVEVREMPAFDLTVIPFLWSADPDGAIVQAANGMAADPEGHELLWVTRTLLPIGDLDVTAHEPVLSSSNNVFVLQQDTEAIRAIEGGTGHYMGMMSGPVTGGATGVTTVRGRVSFSIPNASVMAHELGHNMSLGHAPCGDPRNLDPSFPHRDGSTGAWGYDFRDGGSLVRPESNDLMSYCSPRWISDYHFSNALRFRLFDRGSPQIVARSLLLWGGMDAVGEPFLNPAVVVEAPAALPDSTGEHRITGRTASGGELFSISFTMPETADGDGSSSFAFVLPAQPGWAGNLANITLSGPGGSATLDSNTDLPMAILLDPRSGQVRGILRDPPQADAAAALAPQPGLDGLEVLSGRGIPDAAAWSR